MVYVKDLPRMRAFYSDTVEAVAAFAAGAPIRVVNPEALGRRG